jgi:glycosyltransferase involved in cell wall biosynthesis
LKKIGAVVKIVDSFSIDRTIEIAKSYPDVDIYQNLWVNYAEQFNWGIENCSIKTPWVMRIDADEYMDDELSEYILNEVKNLSSDVNGIYVKRGNYFLDKPINCGEDDVYHLKVWRNGTAFCENKWMDEHMVIQEGSVVTSKGLLIDHNLHSISRFLEKHNSYATREAIDYFERYEPSIQLTFSASSRVAPTHKVKNLYYRFPLFVRPLIYYLYIIFVKGGILGGLEVILYHTIQKLGYRFVVDLKIYEARRNCRDVGLDPVDYLKKCL